MMATKKPLAVKNYGSIPHLSGSKLGPRDYVITEGQEKILTVKTRDRHDEVLVFEKYDGSNVGVAKKNGEIFALTRSGYPASTSPFPHHHEFDKWVRQRSDQFNNILGEGERVVGEWLYQAHGLIYKITADDPIVFFDYFGANNKRCPYDDLVSLGLPLPRLLYRGDAVSVETLKPTLNLKTPSICPNELPEGMVYRVERKGKVDFLAKWVRVDFTPGKYIINVDPDNFVYNI